MYKLGGSAVAHSDDRAREQKSEPGTSPPPRHPQTEGSAPKSVHDEDGSEASLFDAAVVVTMGTPPDGRKPKRMLGPNP
jgi:hypothetical protein